MMKFIFILSTTSARLHADNENANIKPDISQV